jgi:hypothetical protein
MCRAPSCSNSSPRCHLASPAWKPARAPITMTHTHVLKVAAGSTASSLDAMALER